MEYPQDILKNFKPKQDFFVGCDSDGCVLDTMEIKQKECFCPNNIKFWGLQPIAKYARETTEFVNLYSKWRGSNRFPALLKIFDLLEERDEVKARNFKVPSVQTLRAWVASGVPLSNALLKEAIIKTNDPVLKQTFDWSNAVNKAIEDLVYGIPPFPYAAESIEKLVKQADMVCVSQTPTEVVEREWSEHDIAKFATLIAGQELGSKRDHLRLSAGNKYPKEHVLMVGDALGDQDAAEANGFLFFPIIPGHEEASWKLFHDEALTKFFKCQYAGAYEESLIKEFHNYLPETPPWRIKAGLGNTKKSR